MSLVVTGIDEAGLGPLLGPLAVVAVSVLADDGIDATRAMRRARTGLKDSKSIHVSGNIEPIESVALAGLTWLTGSTPASASDVFALLGESDTVRAGIPWMADANRLTLPVAANKIRRWRVDGVQPLAVRGDLIHPQRYNHLRAGGTNKADLELGVVGSLLADLPAAPAYATCCDRLGGRRYYGDFLGTVWPEALIAPDAETPMRSAYTVRQSSFEHRIAFCVDGESTSPFTALASCVAKYARELHMLLFNRWWSEQMPTLRPTAGYTVDARRWLGDIGKDHIRTWSSRLVRGWGLSEWPIAEDQQSISFN